MKEVISALLQMSDRQIDDRLKDMLRTWSEPPESGQVLKALDMGVHGALCSDFVIKTLEVILDDAMKREGLSYEQVVARATWRHQY